MRRSEFFLASACALLFAGTGCGGSGNGSTSKGTGGSGAGGGSGGDASGGTFVGGSGGAGGSSSGDVSGTIADTYVTPAGEVVSPPAKGSVYLAALVPKGGGTPNILTAQIAADGTFKIPGVPDGVYYLRYQNAILVTSERFLDLGIRYAGRPDAVYPKSPTTLEVSATGLTPWDSLDDVELFSPGSGTWATLTGTPGAGPFPAPGATALSALAINMQKAAFPRLIDGKKGDAAFFTQLVTQNSGAIKYTSIGSVLSPASFTQSDGQITSVNGAFQVVPQKKASIDFKRSEFAALASSVHPQAAAVSFDVSAIADPGGASGTRSSLPTVLSLSDDKPSDVILDLGYGNPFPASFGVFGSVSAGFSVQIVPPGQADPRSLFGSISTTALLDDLTKGPVTPALSPIQNLQINGKPATDVLTGVGPTPLVTWNAPSKGTAQGYLISVRRLNASPPATTVVSLFTKDKTVTLPPDTLVSGEAYYLLIRALSAFEIAKPFKAGNLASFADAVTAPFAE